MRNKRCVWKEPKISKQNFETKCQSVRHTPKEQTLWLGVWGSSHIPEWVTGWTVLGIRSTCAVSDPDSWRFAHNLPVQITGLSIDLGPVIIASNEDESKRENYDEGWKDQKETVHQIHVGLIECNAENELHHNVNQETEKGCKDSKERIHQEMSVTSTDAHLFIHSWTSSWFSLIVLFVMVIVCRRMLVVLLTTCMLLSQMIRIQDTRSHSTRVPLMVIVMMMVTVRVTMLLHVCCCNRIQCVDPWFSLTLSQTSMITINGPNRLGESWGEDVKDNGMKWDHKDQNKSHDWFFSRMSMIIDPLIRWNVHVCQ